MGSYISIPYDLLTVDGLAYFMFGMGVFWAQPTAFFQQTPALELSQPESTCIGMYMNAAVQLGNISIVGYLGILNVYGNEVMKHTVIIMGILCTACASCFLAALYYIVVDNFSIMVYVSLFLGGAAGSLSMVVVNQYLMKRTTTMISFTRAGSDFLTISAAALAAGQQPGSPNPKFNVSVYMIIFGCVLIIPFISFGFIEKFKLGLRSDLDLLSNIKIEKKEGVDLTTHKTANNPIVDRIGGNLNNSSTHSEISVDSQEGEEGEVTRRSTKAQMTGLAAADEEKRYSLSEAVHLALSRKGVPSVAGDGWYHTPLFMGWQLRILPYLCAITLADINTWGLISSLAPFAFNNWAPGSSGSAEFLAYAYEAGAAALICGDFSTLVFSAPLKVLAVVYCCFASILYIAVGTSAHGSEARAGGLVFVFVCIRFLEAHMVTSSYRKISLAVSDGNVERAARFVGVVDQALVTTATIITTSVLSSTKC